MPSDIRPTQNLVRKALFDVCGQEMKEFIVLELFAGSGAVGMEAISRGAKFVIFVDHNPKSCKVIKKNCDLLEIENYDLLEQDAYSAIKDLSRSGQRFDFVFVDPPFGLALAKKALKTLGGYDILQPNCQVVIQHDKKEILPQSAGRISRFKEKIYGSNVLSIYQIAENIT